MLFFFSLLVIVMIVIEYQLYKSLLNPFILISSIYLILININNLWANKKYGFFLVSNEAMLALLICLVLVFVLSLLFYIFKMKKILEIKNHNENYKSIVLEKEKMICLFFYTGLVSRYIALVQTIMRFGIDNLKGNAFGIFAHIGSLSIVLMPLVIVIFLENKKKVWHLIAILLVFINMLLYGGKYNLLINITFILMFYALLYGVNLKRAIKISFLLISFTILVFFITYVVRPMYQNGIFSYDFFEQNLKFSQRHFFYYLLSPVIAMNNFFFLKAPTDIIGIQILFTVPINIIKAIFRTGNYVNPIYNFTVPVSPVNGTNVSGFFAEVIMNGGWVLGITYIVVFFSFVYLVLFRYLNRGRQTLLLSYLLATTLFFFFGNFLTVSGVFLNMLYLIAIEFILSKNIKIKLKKISSDRSVDN